MKKRILSVLLLLAMLVTMIPFAAAAEEVSTEGTTGGQTETEQPDVGDLYEWYVKEGLTNLFTTFGDENGVDLTAGTWTAKVGTGVATLGTKARWTDGEFGGIGFNVLYGTVDSEGAYTTTSDYNNHHTDGLKLNFGIGLLPASDYTVEYLAMYKPIYVAATDGSVLVKEGAKVEAYDAFKDEQLPKGWLSSNDRGVDNLGWYTSYTNRVDGVDTVYSATGRGQTFWCFDNPTWYAGHNSWKYQLQVQDDPYQTNNVIRAYSITLDETLTVTTTEETTETPVVDENGDPVLDGEGNPTYETTTETVENRTTDASFGVYRDGTLYYNKLNASTANAAGATYYYDIDTPYKANAAFALSHSRPTDFFAARIYDRALTVDEMKQNRMVDLLLYYGIELTAAQVADERLRDNLTISLADYAFETEAAAKTATETAILDVIALAESDIAFIEDYAAPDHLTAFFSVYADGSVDLAKGTWRNLMGGADATFGTNWVERDNGAFGFDMWAGYMTTTDGTATYTAGKTGVAFPTDAYIDNNDPTSSGYALNLGLSNLSTEDFTVEYQALYRPVLVADASKSTADTLVYYEQDGALLAAYDIDGNNSIPNVVTWACDVFGWFSTRTMKTDGGSGWSSSKRGAVHWMVGHPKWSSGSNYKFVGGGWGTGIYNNGGEALHKAGVNSFFTYTVSVDETVTDTGDTEALLAIYRDAELFGSNAANVNSTANAVITSDKGTNYYDYGKGYPTQTDFSGKYGDSDYGAYFYLSAGTPTDFLTVRVYDKVLTEAEQQQNRLADILYYYGIELSDRILEDEDVYAAVAAIISECDIVSDPAEKQATKVALEAKIQAYLDFIDDLNYDDTMYVTEGLTSFFTAFEGEESFINTDGANKVWYNRVVGQANATFKGGNIWKLGEGGGVGKYYIRGTYTDGVFNETNASNTSVTNDYSLYFGNALLPKDDFTVEYLAFFPQIYAEVVVNGEKTGELYGHYEAGYTTEGHAVDRIGWVEFVSVYPGGKFDSMDNYLRARVSMSDCTGWPKPYSDKYGFGTSAFRIDKRNTLKVDTYGVLRDETTVTEEGVVVEQKATYTVRHNAGAQANGSRSYTTKDGFVAEGGTVKEGQYFFGEDEGGFWLSKSAGATFYAVRIYDRVLTEAEQQQNRLADILYYYDLKLDPAIAADADLTARFAAAVAGITLAIDPLEKAAAKLEISDAATALLTVESPIYNLYVENGMTAHFSSLLPTDGSASVAAGVWKNRVAGGANATFGNADMWKKNPNGSVGYSLFYGQMDADGNFTKDSAYNTYNHTTACGTNLNLGIDLLPEDNFTVEFVAMFKPIYVADAAGDIAVDAEGNLVEAAKQGYDWISGKNPSEYEYGVVIRMGYLQAFAYPHDGYWEGKSSHKRGDYMWTISGALGWKESNSTNKPLAGLSGNEDVLFTNSVVRSYAITRTEDADVHTKVTYGFVRDGATYFDWEFDCATVKANVNGYAVANFAIAEKKLTKDQVNAIASGTVLADGKYNMKAKPADNPDAPDERMTYAPANKFLLSERHPTDFYAVRIYDRVLTKEEQMRNHLADIALYYGLDLGDEIFTGSALGNELLSDFAEALSTATIVTNGLEKRANKAFYQSVIDNIVFEATYESPSDYSEMYVTEGLVGLFTAFTGSGTVDVFKGEWQNEAPAAAVATYGSAKLEGSWTKELLGVGYTASGSTWDDISKQLNRSISLSDKYEELENFTVEAFATVIGGTDVNGNRFVYESTDKDGNLLGVAGQAHTPGRNNFRFGILTSLGFNTLSGINGIAATDSAANLGNRWAVTNIAYTGKNWTAQQAYAAAADAQYATVYDDKGWVSMGVDVYTPAPGLMQVTKASDSNGITYNVAYNNDAPSVSFSMSSGKHSEIKNYTEKGRDYETGRRFSLFNTQAATVYAVRVYDRVLSAEEMLINSFVDKAAYYQLEIDSFADFETAEKVEVANIFANLSYDRDKADVQALYDFYAKGGAERLVNTLVGFDGYNPILATASGYRAVFQVNQEAYNLLTKSGYTVTYGALVAPGGNFNSLEDVTLENESVKNIVVAGEGGSGIYYKPAGARGYYYTAAVTADDPVYYSVGMIVRGYAVVTKGEESFVVYTDATLNGSNQVSIFDAADYFVNAYDGDIVTQYTYMNSAVLRNILEESGYAARVSLEDDLTIYVDAENGNDDNNGQTLDTAYKTVNAAFAAAKAHFAQAGRKTVTIRLAAGTYNVTEELVLKAEDILATGYSLDVIGAGDSTILTTETEIAYDSALEDAAGNRYVQLPAGANGLYPDFRTLYVNGKFVNHATGGSHEDTYGIEDFYILDANDNKLNPVQAYDRNQDGTIDENDHGSDGKPTNDWYLDEEGVSAAKWAVFTLPASMFDTRYLAQYAGAELHYTWDWASSMSHIDHVEQSGDSVLAYVHYGQLAYGYENTKIAGKRAWLENALVLATSPVHASEGYYYDSVSGRLYYKGLSETPKLTYASLSNMFVFENVDNISIQNMAITGVDSNYITDDIGIHLSQGGLLTIRNNKKQATSLGWVEHAAIYGKNMDNLLVSNVSVHDVAGAGVTIKGYATDIIIDSSSFENIGGSAIQIAGYKDDGSGEYIKDITITNNYVNLTGQLYRACAAIMTGNVASAKVIGNTVIGSTWSAFSFGRSWKAPKATNDQIVNGATFYCYDLEIAYNYVTDMMTCQGDGGAFYLNGGAVSIASNDTKAYNYLHHNYVVMSENSGLHGNNANGWRSTYCYYFENSTSNWLATENVLVNEVNQNPSYAKAAFYGVFLQSHKDGEARNVTLLDNYFIGFEKIGQVYSYHASNPNAELGQVANDYVFMYPSDLALNFFLGDDLDPELRAPWNNATNKTLADWDAVYGVDEEGYSLVYAEEVVSSIFHAAGSDKSTVGKKVSFAYNGFNVSKYSAADRVVLKEGNVIDVTEIEDIEISTVTFTDGETSVSLKGLVGSPVKAPTYFAQPNYTYTFSVDGTVVDLADYAFPAEGSVEIDVTAVAETYTVEFVGGIVETSVEVFEGDTFEIPAEMKIAGKNPTLYYDGAELDLATFKMPAEDIRVRIEYKDARYTARFVDESGRLLKENDGRYGNRVTNPKLTKDYHTTQYLLNGVVTPIEEIVFPEGNLEITVKYVPNTYDVQFRASVITAEGATVHNYGSVNVVFGQVIDASTIDTSAVPGYKEGALLKFVAWQNFTSGVTVLDAALMEAECIVYATTEWEDLPAHNATFTGDGFADITVSVFEGSAIKLPAELLKAGYNVVLTANGKPVDLATYTMPTEDVTFTVAYEAIEYTVTITDNLGKSDSFTGIYGATVTFNTVFTAPDEHKTVVYKVNGGKIDLATYKVPVDGAEIVVEYVDILYSATIFDKLGNSQTVTGIFGAAVEFNMTDFVAPENTTIKYSVNGGDLVDTLSALTFTVEPITVEVVYVENAPVEPEYKLGDFNNDGEVDGGDLLLLARLVAGQVDKDAVVGKTDLNGDGETDGGDLLLLARAIAGQATLQ